MPIDKRWIHKKRNCSEYDAGIKKFIEKARLHVNEEGKIRCPCVRCYNGKWHKPDLVKLHCMLKGFSKTYQTWYFHGEQFGSNVLDKNENEDDDQEREQDEMVEALQDIAGPSGAHTEVGNDDDNPMMSDHGRTPITKKSKTNKSNRELQPYAALTGSKSIPAHSYDMRDHVTGEEPSRLHLWNTLHFDKKKNQWINERAEVTHAQLVERLSSQDSTTEPINDDVIFEEVLGSRSGYKRGWGPLPKGTSRSRSSSSSENSQLKVELHECRELLAQQEDKLAQQEDKLAQQQNELTQQQKTIQDLKATTDELTTFMRQLVPGYRPSRSQQTSPP